MVCQWKHSQTSYSEKSCSVYDFFQKYISYVIFPVYVNFLFNAEKCTFLFCIFFLISIYSYLKRADCITRVDNGWTDFSWTLSYFAFLKFS